MILTPEHIKKLPFRSGPLDAKLAIIGEAAGLDEMNDPENRPFIGKSGQLLRSFLKSVGLNPNEIYITNVIKEHPYKNDLKKWISENPKAYSMYLDILSAELSILTNANLFVCAGAEATKIVCPKSWRRNPSIEAWRGSILEASLPSIAGRKVIPIIHPAAIYRNWLYKPTAVAVDFPRIAKEVKTKEIILPKRTYFIRPSFDLATTKLDAIYKSGKKVSVDIETAHHRMATIQFSVEPEEAICIPFEYKDGRSYWPIDQELIIMRMILKILEDFKSFGPRLLGQNFVTFDTFMLSLHGFNPWNILRNIYLDVMEGFQCYQPQLPKGLDFLTSIYTREPYYKKEGKERETRLGEEEFWRYGCKDVMVVVEIARQLEKELKNEDQWEFYKKKYLEMSFRRMRLSLFGLNRNEKKRAELEKTFIRDTLIAQCKLILLAGENINVKSNPQMKHLLYDVMKLPKQYTKEGKVTTNEEALLALSAKAPSEIFKHILNIRHLRTLYGNNIITPCDSDGRIRSSYGFTETGRLTSYGCPSGSGGNFQNWNKKMRVMIVGG